MASTSARSRIIQFGTFVVDLETGEIHKAGVRQKLTGLPFQVLCVLLERSQKIVTREELQARVWPKDTFVDYDLGLRKAITRIREVLGDSTDSPRFIETIPRKGYRFIAPVTGNGFLSAPGVEEPIAESLTAAPKPKAHWKPPLLLVSLTSILLVALALRFLPGIITGRAAQIHSIVVLPFEDLSRNSERQYLADGITDALTTDLAQVDGLQVISRTSAVQVRSRKWTTPEIGRALNVDAVLEGTVSYSVDRVRITAQLIQAQTDKHLWARSYERNVNDVLALQDEVARDIAQEIQSEVRPRQRASVSPPRPIKPQAYDAYMQGRYHWNERTPKELLIAVGYFNQAIALDPDYALSYAGLADCYAMLATTKGNRPSDMLPKAKDALLKALALDDSNAEAHTTLGWVKESEWDWTGSEQEFVRAIKLNSSYATAHHRYAQHLAAQGKLQQALAEIRKAQQLDPLSPAITASAGWVLLRSGLPDQAMPECRKAVDMDSTFARGHLCLGEVYEQEQMLEQAASEFLEGRVLAGDDAATITALKHALASAGYTGYFRERLQQLTDKSKSSYVSPYDLAAIYIRLGETEQALRCLNAAYNEHSPSLANLQIEEKFNPLRSDLRFQDLVRRLGLPEHLTTEKFNPAENVPQGNQ